MQTDHEQERFNYQYIVSSHGIYPDIRKCPDGNWIPAWNRVYPWTVITAWIFPWKRNAVFTDYCIVCIAGNVVCI